MSYLEFDKNDKTVKNSDEMTQEEYDKKVEDLKDFIYSEVGEKFPIRWEKTPNGVKPVIEEEDLPESVSKKNLENTFQRAMDKGHL